MPPLPQFRGGSSVAFGPAPTPNVRPSNVGELISGIGQAVGGIEDALHKKDDEDGRIWAAKTQTELRGKYNQRLMEAQNSGEDLNGFTPKIKAELDADLQNARKAAPNKRGVYHLDLATPDFTTDVQGAAFGAEARYGVTKRAVDAGDIIEANRGQVFSNPKMFAKLYSETKTLVDGLSLPIEAKARLQDQLNGMGRSAIEGMIENGNPYEAAKQLKSGAWNKYVDPDTLAALTNRAQSEIRSREAEARSRQAAAGEGVYSGAQVLINRFANGQGDFSETNLLDLKDRLPVDRYNALQIQFDDARARRAEAEDGRADVAAILGGGGHIDPNNKKQTRAYDDYFRNSVLPELSKAPDPQAAVLSFIGQHGIVPESVTANLRASLRSGSADERAAAAATVEQVKTVAPRALRDFDDDTLRQANTISAYIDGGMSSADAVRLADEALRQPKVVDDALDATYNQLTKDDPTSDWLASAFDEDWIGGPTVPVAVSAEVSSLTRAEFKRNGGNLEGARRTALDMVKKRYGATRVNGAPVVVRNPIEQHFGVPWLSPEENAKAIKEEAVAEMNTGWTDGKLSADRVRIQPYPAKGVVTADGRPAYALEVQDSTGAWTVQMDLNEKSPTFGLPKPWIPSLEGAKAARNSEVQGAVAEAKGEVPAGAIVEGTQVYDQPKGKPKRLIGTTAGGSFRRLAPGYDKP